MLNLSPPLFISLMVVLFVGFPFHELAHAYVADYFGDDTPRLQGRLSLNPLVHLDFLGALMLLFAGFGWAKPVMVDQYTLQRRSPAAPMLVALAGPISNLLLAVLVAFPVRVGLITPAAEVSRFLPSLYEIAVIFVRMNLILMLFNLIPLFPLDGEKVAMYFLPYRGQQVLLKMRRYGVGPLMAVFLLSSFLNLPILDFLVGRPMLWLAGLLLG